ncbi:hypothetical protein GZH53_00830 [Flavihumibacter sp. R14]|nr:hypothetical protein [Flavihumibacter soli]
MKQVAIINKRRILYQRHDDVLNWASEFPGSNWLLLTIVAGKSKMILDDIAQKAIDRSVCYGCCVGLQGELLHDFFDENIAARTVGIENNFLPDFEIMTTWHDNVDDALWFSIFTAAHDTEHITTVVCLDASVSEIESSLTESIVKMQAGWIPD